MLILFLLGTVVPAVVKIGNRVNRNERPQRPPVVQPHRNVAPARPPVAPLMMAGPEAQLPYLLVTPREFRNEQISVEVINLRYRVPMLMEQGTNRIDVRRADSECLVVTLRITNRSRENPILEFQPAAGEQDNWFQLRKKSGDPLPALRAGGAVPAEGLRQGAKLTRGRTVFHDLFFELPEKSSEPYVLTIDLAAVELEGQIEFQVPGEALAR